MSALLCDAWSAGLQAALARGLGWHFNSTGNAGSVDADSCSEHVLALYRRAQYYAAGIKAQRDSGKPFVPDWSSLESSDAAQQALAQHAVWWLALSGCVHAVLTALPSKPADSMMLTLHLICSLQPHGATVMTNCTMQAMAREAAGSSADDEASASAAGAKAAGPRGGQPQTAPGRKPAAKPRDRLLHCTVLLSRLPQAELDARSRELASKPAAEQLLVCYRDVRGQEFLARQLDAVVNQESWLEAEYARHAPKHTKTCAEQQDAFFERMQSVRLRRLYNVHRL